MKQKPSPITIDVNILTLDELFEFSSHMMARVLKLMSPEHKAKLLLECEEKIYYTTMQATRVGQACVDAKGITRFPEPYTLVKKYSYMYTCIAGWQSESDLEERAAESGRRQWYEERVTELREESKGSLMIPVEMLTYAQLKEEYEERLLGGSK